MPVVAARRLRASTRLSTETRRAAVPQNETATPCWTGPARWRQRGAMLADSKCAAVRTLDRINLRLAPEMFEALDAARQSRPGNISRNTWITEAIEEKLAHEQGQSVRTRGARANG